MPLRPTPTAVSRPRRALALAAGGLAAALLLADVAGATSASAATAQDFARLRQCESGGNYAINTGNGYYGAYQFSAGTWQGMGYAGLPSRASAATQDAAARRLQAARGWHPWPTCATRLGLGGVSRPAAVPARASRSRAVPLRSSVRVPYFSGHVISTRDRQHYRHDVALWQRHMAWRGYHVTVDGYFGPQSAHAAQRFAVVHRLHPVRRGTVDRALWNRTWIARHA